MQRILEGIDILERFSKTGNIPNEEELGMAMKVVDMLAEFALAHPVEFVTWTRVMVIMCEERENG